MVQDDRKSSPREGSSGRGGGPVYVAQRSCKGTSTCEVRIPQQYFLVDKKDGGYCPVISKSSILPYLISISEWRDFAC